MSEVTRLSPELTGAQVVEKLISGGGALRRHPPHPAGPPKGIKKDGHNLYRAQVATTDPDYTSHQDLAQRVNALQLSFNHVVRELQIMQGRNDPYAPAYNRSNNVYSMKEHVARSRVTQGAVPGNEAENLDENSLPFELPSSTSQPSKADTVPRHVPQPTPKTGLRGVDIHPEETVKRLSTITDIHPDRVADVAWRHGMDLVELTDIAYAVYSKRELSCYELYDRSRDNVKFDRFYAQYRLDERPGKNGPHVYRKSEDSKFAAWARKTLTYEVYLNLVSNEKLEAIPTTHTRTHPLVPGEVVARQRIADQRKDEARERIAQLHGRQEVVLPGSKRTRREKYHDIEKVSKRLSVGHHVTTSSQIAGFSSAFRAFIDGVGKAVGMNQRKVGMRKKRLEYILESKAVDPNEFPSVKLGYWTKRWWELPKSHSREQTDPVWTPIWQTVRTGPRTTERWHDPDSRNIEDMAPLARMRYISQQLVQRGSHDSDHVQGMEHWLLSHYGTSVLKADYVDTDKPSQEVSAVPYEPAQPPPKRSRRNVGTRLKAMFA